MFLALPNYEILPHHHFFHSTLIILQALWPTTATSHNLTKKNVTIIFCFMYGPTSYPYPCSYFHWGPPPHILNNTFKHNQNVRPLTILTVLQPTPTTDNCAKISSNVLRYIQKPPKIPPNSRSLLNILRHHPVLPKIGNVPQTPRVML